MNRGFSVVYTGLQRNVIGGTLYLRNSFSVLGGNFDGAWLCIGDFNHILDQSEKLGGRTFASTSSCPFKSFIDRFGLIDLGFSGNPFTWSNNRRDTDLIKERLDRGLASSRWVHIFPSFSVLHFPAFSSDHNPILLNTSLCSPSTHRPFKFEEFWIKDPTCAQVIAAAWSVVISGSPAYCLVQKLKITKAALKRWNSLHFGNIITNIKAKLLQLDQAQKAPHPSLQGRWNSSSSLTLRIFFLKRKFFGATNPGKPGSPAKT
jgi:hypothetical protein